jgi:RNA polymerase sigma factor (sigma-70 family)
MKITHPSDMVLLNAASGDLAAIDAMLRAIQPGVYNLAVRMLGNRDDGADACQEILLKVVTHLSSFRAASNFTTWVFQIARNHLLTSITRSNEHPTSSLDAMAEKLALGLRFSEAESSLTAQDKLEAKQIAIGCTQNMLMALDREQRLAYLLDVIFGLTSDEGAAVLGLSSSAYRKRLSRAKQSLDQFTNNQCGLNRSEASFEGCRCEKQLPAIRSIGAKNAAVPKLVAIHRIEISEATRQFDSIVRLSDASALFQAHPEYRASDNMIIAIRSVLQREGHWPDGTANSIQ